MSLSHPSPAFSFERMHLG